MREDKSVAFRAVGCKWAVEIASGLIQIPGRISDPLGRRILIIKGFLHLKQNSNIARDHLVDPLSLNLVYHLFIQQAFLSACCVPRIVLGAGNM